MPDLYRYFRIEARELIDEIAADLSNLVQGGSTADLTALVLRHAHTLKGAARVVGQQHVADHAHALEELLEPFRGSTSPVPDESLGRMQALVDEISGELESLGAGPVPAAETPVPAAEPPIPVAETSLPAPRSGPEQPLAESPTDTDQLHQQTARASLTEIDAIIAGVLETRGEVGFLRQSLQGIDRFRAQVRADPGNDPAARLRKVTRLEFAAEETYRVLIGCADRMERELREVHDTAERMRLIPVESIVPDLQRSVRDVAAAQGKRVALQVVGARIALDAPVLATAQTALRQIVRNAVAHGVETPDQRLAAGKDAVGQVRLHITHDSRGVIFSCTDDGRGIDLAAVRTKLSRGGMAGVEGLPDDAVLDLLLAGGVSTATTVSEISGRGIGLDIVRDAARQLGGRVRISTQLGDGTTIDLTTPPSLTAQDVILMDAGDPVAVPLAAVQAALRVSAEEISAGSQGESLIHEGRAIPFIPIQAALGENPAPTSQAHPSWSVLILRTPTGAAAIGARRLLGTAGVAVRPLPPLAAILPVVSGLWMDVDGRPRMVLDPLSLAAAAGRIRSVVPLIPRQRAPILIVDDSLTTRMLEQTILESAGYQVEMASSAEEGLALAARKPFSLVVVDVEMPGMDGFAFVEQTRARPELRHLP
jgi:two-component system chemotaxis sensor kinase CheA